MGSPAARLQWAASLALIALIALCLAWELVLAPLRPGGSWLALKCLPLLLPLMGVLRGHRYTYQWASLLIWFYVAEGATRAFTDAGPGRWLAVAEALLALAFFFAVVGCLRVTRRSSAAPPDPPAPTAP
ncbi:MAG: DUF2069 domain-containing protein [Betaproteobacteria bacterium]|nr:DUF2069 domain-containing protein [Betaproteobacteria bacterium]